MTEQQPTWNEQQEKGNFFLLRFVFAVYRLLGRRVMLWMVRVIVAWYWIFAVQARRNSRLYFDRLAEFAKAHPEFEQHTVAETQSSTSTLTHLQTFAESIVDKMAAWQGDIPEQELQLFGHQHFQQNYGRGAILMISHFGNIELLRALKSEHHQTVNVLVYRKHAEQFNAFLQSINPRAGVQLISVDELGVDTALHLQERLNQGEWLVVAADRIPIHSKRCSTATFLGYDAEWPQGAWLLAHLLNAPVMAVFCYPYQQEIQVHIELLSDNIQLSRKQREQQLGQYIERFVRLQEQHCLRAPYQWFNFYDFWKK